jgi:hypothetical protein
MQKPAVTNKNYTKAAQPAVTIDAKYVSLL